MSVLGDLIRLAHLLGLGLAIGAATAKLLLLLKTRADRAFVGTYLAVAAQLTRLILTGTALLVLSGIGWLVLGYPLSGLLIGKIVLVVIAMVVGGTMDRSIEPRFAQAAAESGAPTSTDFNRIQRQYVLAESLATGLYFVIVVMWVLR